MIRKSWKQALWFVALTLTAFGCKGGPEADDLKDYAFNKYPSVEGHLERVGEIEQKIARTFGLAASTSLEQVQSEYLPALTALEQAIQKNGPATADVKAIHERLAKAVALRLAAAKTLKEALSKSSDAGRDIPDEPRKAFSDAMQESDREISLSRADMKELAKKLGVKLPD